ncbi:SDR family oxidoreductase [Occallatibacter savannae]|uniref:SDR family oxidoreductase n=1 Tax=Occallatibacter savannae TaxID=1002691 RepID=UPI000D68D803|nr:SDR family oxidoreductase [Occallatibacter savannae]
MDLALKDKLVVVTGGGAGIGAGISRACLDEGARVIVLGRPSENVQAFMAEMQAAKVSCHFVEAHLEDLDRCRTAIQEIEQQHGDIYGLVNNAGVNDGAGLEKGTVDRFVESLRKNLIHYYALAHYALPSLKRTQGAIVNISSKVALTGQGNTSGYAASKGAQLALTREWAAELLKYNIRVNAVLPAEVMTPLYRRWLDTLGDPDAELKRITDKIPLGHRMTLASEIAASTVFLLSPTQSAHTTGQHIIVDGGYVHLDRALT